MDKLIKDWTLSEAQEYCHTYMATLKEGYCDESGCELARRGICYKDWVHDWNLNAFTQEEIDGARAIRRLIPNATSVERIATEGLLIKRFKDTTVFVDGSLFPSIKVGQTVNLLDIINS